MIVYIANLTYKGINYSYSVSVTQAKSNSQIIIVYA